MLSVTGYVTGEPREEEGNYGRYCTINLRFKLASAKSLVHYATARVYGSRIQPVLDWIHDGDQITIHGPIKKVEQKSRKSDGTTYLQFYMDASYYSFPAKKVEPEMMNRPMIGLPNTMPGESEDEDMPF